LGGEIFGAIVIFFTDVRDNRLTLSLSVRGDSEGLEELLTNRGNCIGTVC
jgi:hypothetical protein